MCLFISQDERETRNKPEDEMLTKEEMQLRNAMKLLVRDGKSGQHFEAAKERYINLMTDERIRNISNDLDPSGRSLADFIADCNVINGMIA
jgi:hypothetical protein